MLLPILDRTMTAEEFDREVLSGVEITDGRAAGPARLRGRFQKAAAGKRRRETPGRIRGVLRTGFHTQGEHDARAGDIKRHSAVR